MSVTAQKKISKARAVMMFDHVFWGHIAIRLNPKEAKDLPYGAATDSKSLFYNPEYIDSLPDKQVITVCAHEVAHCVFLHHLRMGNRNPELWNVACDFVINSILVENNFEPVPGWLYDKKYEGMHAEKVYSLIEQELEKNGQSKGEGYIIMNGGSGSGKSEKLTKEQLIEKIVGEIMPSKNADGSPMSEADRIQSEIDWKVIIQQAAQTAKSMGKIPAGMARYIEEIVNPKIDWRSALRKFVLEKTKNDYRWSRPNRRHIAAGMYLPSLDGEKLGKIAAIIDTSGSISNQELSQFQGELNDILETYQSEFVAIYCDADVAGAEEFSAHDLPVHLKAAGGGGTDMTPGFKYIEDQGIEPVCILCFTDGEMNSPDITPEASTLWVLTRDCKSFSPHFGDVTVMEDV